MIIYLEIYIIIIIYIPYYETTCWLCDSFHLFRHCFLSHGFKRYAVYTLGSVGQVMVSFMLSLHAPSYGAVTYRVIFQGGRSQSLPVVLLNSTSVSPLGDPR